MSKVSSPRLKKLNSNTFSQQCVVKIEICYEKLCDKSYEQDFPGLLTTDFLDELEAALKAGPSWKFNSTCLDLFITENTFKYDKSILARDVLEHGKITHQEIDVNKSLFKLNYSIRVLLMNAAKIDTDLILKSPMIRVKTLIGIIHI